MQSTILADGIYSYARPAMGNKEDAVTAQVVGGQITEGTYNGQSMTGSCWRACTLADLNVLAFTFTPAPRPIGKTSACELHKDLARLGYARISAHAQLASEALERSVTSFTALNAEEARAVWSYACAQMGLADDGQRAA